MIAWDKMKDEMEWLQNGKLKFICNLKFVIQLAKHLLMNKIKSACSYK